MGIWETKRYYAAMTPEDLCSCAYCRNYMEQVKAVYPRLSKYLGDIGVDVEKPFETMPLEPDGDGTIVYLGVQYIVLGDKVGFEKTAIADKPGEVSIELARSHPGTDIVDPHYVIEIEPIRLPWTGQDESEAQKAR